MRNRTRWTDALTLLAALTAIGSSGCAPDDADAPAGGVPRHVLDEPEVVSGEFGSVNGIRVTPDGSLLVADRISGELVLADLDAGTRTVVGSRGEGPQEYEAPSGLWPFPGDSTLLVDGGNNRLTVLGPDFSFGRTRPRMEMLPEGGVTLLTPRGVDEAGRIYTGGAVTMNIGAGARSSEPGSDSSDVVRVELSDLSTTTVARLAPRVRPSLESRTSAGNIMLSMQQPPYTPSDSWGVAPDGSVVIARASDYHLDWIAPDGSVRSGAPVIYDPVSAGQAEKEAWVAGQGGLAIGGTSFSLGSGGGGSLSSGISGRTANVMIDAGSDDVDDYDWPAVLPAFTGRVLIDGQGRAWLRRYQPVGAPWLYDIFTPDAERAGTVEIANGHTVIGFGDSVVYATFKDEVDLVYIERFRLPGM